VPARQRRLSIRKAICGDQGLRDAAFSIAPTRKLPAQAGLTRHANTVHTGLTEPSDVHGAWTVRRNVAHVRIVIFIMC